MDEYEEKRKLKACKDTKDCKKVKKQKESVPSILTNQKGKASVFFCRAVKTAVFLLCVLLVLMPNVSTAYAQSMGDIPVVGDLIRVFTVRNYFYSDRNHEMDIDVPNISDPRGSDAADKLNNEVDELTAELAKQFYIELEAVGDKGYGAIYVDYEVLMNRENWFTLKLAVNSVAGSGNSYYKIYNIDRNTGKIVRFSDLFCKSNFSEIIKRDIIKQMKQQTEENNMLTYFTDKDINDWEITDKQNFYFNDNGQLVLPLDKYEVAPGSMGNPEFKIDKKTLNGILKPEYQNIVS